MKKQFAIDLTDKANQVLVVSSDESEITVFQNIIHAAYQRNIINPQFYHNIISQNYQDNKISSYFINNNVKQNFKHNETKYMIDEVNFSIATHVYADYNCEIFKNSSGSLKLKYTNETNDTIITDITS